MNVLYRIAFLLTSTIAKTLFSFRVVNSERIIENGGVIIAMNHQSFLDPPLIGICCKRDIFFLARKSLFSWPILGPLLPKMNNIPVDRDGADLGALKTMIKLVRAGECITVFPEGTRTSDGHIQPPKAGIGMIIAKTMAPVVPMRIFGAFEAFPRNRKLPLRRPITIVVGEPIHFTEADIVGNPREVYQKLSEQVIKAIGEIKN